MVEIKETKDAPPLTADVEARLSDVEKTLAEVVERLDTLEKKRDSRGLKEVRDRVEDVCDFLYGNNVRPPLKERGDDDYAAEVKPSNTDD